MFLMNHFRRQAVFIEEKKSGESQEECVKDSISPLYLLKSVTQRYSKVFHSHCTHYSNELVKYTCPCFHFPIASSFVISFQFSWAFTVFTQFRLVSRVSLYYHFLLQMDNYIQHIPLKKSWFCNISTVLMMICSTYPKLSLVLQKQIVMFLK